MVLVVQSHSLVWITATGWHQRSKKAMSYDSNLTLFSYFSPLPGFFNEWCPEMKTSPMKFMLDVDVP